LSIKELRIVGVKEILKGGSTSPLLINAIDSDGNVDPYVLKCYKSDYIDQNFTVAKEIFSTIIAQEFDLPVPDWGIIEFDNSELEGFYSKDGIANLHSGYKFCCEYFEGYQLYNDFVSNSFLKEYHMENVFAFDNIILNVDRGGYRNKPNLLIGNSDFLLIDHELTFPFLNKWSVNNDIDFKSHFVSYDHTKHIFYERLRKVAKKESVFDEFYEGLRSLNLGKLQAIIDCFESFNIECGEKKAIFDYLTWVKDNRDFVCKKLKERLL